VVRVGELWLRDTVRDVVAVRAPEELALLEGFGALSDDEVTRLLRGRGWRGNGPLGFGLPEVATLVTPVVWLVLDKVSTAAAEAAAEDTTRGLGRLARRLLRRRSRRPRSIPRLTPEQLNLVHAQTVDHARAAHLDEDAARALADAVISRLARTTDELPDR
jgi:hypothetical protein